MDIFGRATILYTTDVNLVTLVDRIIQVLYIFIDFLSTGLINYCDRDIDIFGCNYVGVFFFLKFYQFLLHIF